MHELVTASQIVFVSLTEDSLVQFSSFRDRDVKVSSFVSRYSSSFFFMFRVQLREGRGLLDLCSRDLFAIAQSVGVQQAEEKTKTVRPLYFHTWG